MAKPLLLAGLRSTDAQVRWNSATRIAFHKHDANDQTERYAALEPLLGDDEGRVRQAAAKSFEKPASVATAEIVSRALQNSHPEVWTHAIGGIDYFWRTYRDLLNHPQAATSALQDLFLVMPHMRRKSGRIDEHPAVTRAAILAAFNPATRTHLDTPRGTLLYIRQLRLMHEQNELK